MEDQSRASPALLGTKTGKFKLLANGCEQEIGMGFDNERRLSSLVSSPKAISECERGAASPLHDRCSRGGR